MCGSAYPDSEGVGPQNPVEISVTLAPIHDKGLRGYMHFIVCLSTLWGIKQEAKLSLG